MYRKLTFAVMLGLVAAVALVFSAGTQAGSSDGTAASGGAQARQGLVVTKVISPAEQRAALAFWTHERVAAAKPLPLAVDTGSPAPTGAAAAAPTGRPGSTSAGGQAAGADAIAQRAYPKDWAGADSGGTA